MGLLRREPKICCYGPFDLSGKSLIMDEILDVSRIRSTIRLSNKLAHTGLQVMFVGEHVRLKHHAAYLGIALVSSLTYRQHLTQTTYKVN